jgi:L-threonylcarbamoyladenylate synthase
VAATEIERGADALRAGKLVVFPTETVYGLGANALDPNAVRKIFEVKGRPLSSPLIVHVASVEMARSLASEWPKEAELLAQRFWPGPLTIVVPKKTIVPDLVTAGLPSVGLRIPAQPLARALLEEARIPIAAPSANRFTELSPTTAAHVRQGLAGADVEMILDGGPCAVGIESTVISLAGPKPRILRPGMVTQTEIETVIGRVEVGGGVESPGQHPKHYSPRTRLVTGEAPHQGHGKRLGLDAMPSDPGAYAERLYRLLHDLDNQGYDWIWVELPPESPEWAGVRDRLIRAAN